MSASLYDISVASYLQVLSGLGGVLAKGRAHEADLNDLVEARIYADMLPLRFQVQQVAHHTLGSVQALQSGAYGAAENLQPLDYAGLEKLVSEARAALEALSPADVNKHAGRDVKFEARGVTLPFTAETLILSFALPNVHFHATTAYDILRMKGVPVGKRDYLGQMRAKG